MSDPKQAFREYVTRVSFSLQLSRNQVAVMRSIAMMIETGDPAYQIGGSSETYYSEIKRRRELGENAHDIFVPGVRWLEANGLVSYTAPEKMKPQWSRCPWQLTPAGEHVVALLRIAGLIPERAANANTARKRARRAT